MKNKKLNYDLDELKLFFQKGINLTDKLKEQNKLNSNSDEIIELVYDIQAGSYIDFANKNIHFMHDYSDEVTNILNQYVSSDSVILDIGSGECTTISYISNKLHSFSHFFCFDISMSRILKGVSFMKVHAKNLKKITPFVGNISEIPFKSSSIDIVISNHALEPNGKNLSNLLQESIRVCSHYLILFEPSYENNSKKGQQRMDSLGYIRGLEAESKKLGCEVVDIIKMKNVSNILNPTYCYIFKVKKNLDHNNKNTQFTYPGTDFILEDKADYLYSKKYGKVFFKFRNIPILRTDNSLLMTTNEV